MKNIATYFPLSLITALSAFKYNQVVIYPPLNVLNFLFLQINHDQQTLPSLDQNFKGKNFKVKNKNRFLQNNYT